jgi:PAS domain S-box-containing protein
VTARLERAGACAGLAAAAIGFVAILGWPLGIEALRSVIPGRIAMNPATAIGFIFSGAAIALIARQPVAADRRAIASVLAVLTGTIGILRLSGYLLDFDPVVDRVLFASRLGANRVAPNTAFCFVLVGIALILEDHERLPVRRTAFISVLAAGFLSFLSLLGHAYGATFLYTWSGYIGMAIPTAMAFLLLAVGILAARPERGPVGVLMSRLPGGAMARSLIPVAILLPIILGYLRMAGQAAGLFGTEFGLALLVSLIVALLTGVILHVAAAVDRSSVERDRIFNLSSDLICVAGSDGCFKSVNPAWTATLGYAPEEVEGKPFLSFTHPDDREKTRAMAEAQAAGGAAVDFENRYRAKDGSWRTLLWAATPVQDNQCIYAIARDITRRKEAEAERERLVSRLAAANQELESFTYSVSHDLRAPLRAVDGFSRILLEEHAPRLDDEGKRLLGIVRENAVRMGQLIDDLLSFSRLGRKSLEFDLVEMTPIVRRVIDDLRAAEPERKVQTALEELPNARVDRAMIRQVWVNLLSNAFKYTRKTSAPRVEIRGSSSGGTVVYEVRDNGAGFDMRYAEKLFGVFQRLHTQTEFEGTGVGLALAKRIVTRHGGSIEGSGALGEGATFRFTLPARGEEGGGEA